MEADGSGLQPDYVELQLRFVARSIDIGTHDPAAALTELTNLHRRFGSGDPTDPPDDRWVRYVDGLAERPRFAEQVRWTLNFAATHGSRPPPSSAVARSGPFSAHVHDHVVRTHFVPSSADEVSPLHRSRLAERREDLRAVLDEARAKYPGIRRVRGASWLYSAATSRDLGAFVLAFLAGRRGTQSD